MFEIWANMWSPRNRRFCAKSIEKSRKQVKNGSFSADFWSKWRDSNSRPPVPETGALPTALHLVLMIFMRFSVSGQTCGQTEDLRNFRQSGVPKKSVFSRGFSVFQNFRFEIGGLHPKLARYHLRYASINIFALKKILMPLQQEYYITSYLLCQLFSQNKSLDFKTKKRRSW